MGILDLRCPTIVGKPMMIQMKFVNSNLNIQYQKEDGADFYFIS